ncbi:hypothetical protein [Hazenella coriacea]|uniref:Uncharacterized protein n=1 Tax=Hazenella coriacea TaxID=1179467 RepID=A0A4R3L6X7_9BACL|nr:hypothetical protein [Hazenella coriacea]TCS95661.1 hypothetical protein EDD58_102237 [Hazenella coriacea]
MPKLEYRLLDELNQFPLVSQYRDISKAEISLRFCCDYFVKGRKVYQKTSSACTMDDTYVIYVVEDPEEQVEDQGLVFLPDWIGIRVEVRQYHEEQSNYPVVLKKHFHDFQDSLLFLMSHFVEINGLEWEKTSTEVDENRKVYVYYAQPTGSFIKGGQHE